MSGSAGDLAARQRFPGARFQEMSSSADAALAIDTGKENAALQAEIDAVLATLKQEGELQRLRAKWVDSGYSIPPPMPVINNSGTRQFQRYGRAQEIHPLFPALP